MKLDIRGLPCGTLVNRHGSTSSRSNQICLFYCGMKVMVGVQGCDGYCGPTNGPNCQACKILQSQANTRYRIWNNYIWHNGSVNVWFAAFLKYKVTDIKQIQIWYKLISLIRHNQK